MSRYSIEEDVGELRAQILALHEREPVDLERSVVAVEHVDGGVLVDEAQVARAVRLPRHLVAARRVREQRLVLPVERHRLSAREAATAPSLNCNALYWHRKLKKHERSLVKYVRLCSCSQFREIFVFKCRERVQVRILVRLRVGAEHKT